VKELQQRGIPDTGISQIEKVINVKGSNEEKLSSLTSIMSGSESGEQGINELKQTLAYYSQLKSGAWQSEVVVDISLARGLNYYTGVIVEVVCSHPDVKMGSIGGGGRYDDLTGLFGLKGLSGVGVSFGIDRIYDVMEELKLFPETLETGITAMVVNFGGDNEQYAIRVLKQLRDAGIAAELYPDAVKFDKQMKYANKRGAKYVIIAGEEEREKNLLSLKNYTTGEQKMITIAEAISVLK
jgi:histidyl-tRNA synthetase